MLLALLGLGGCVPVSKNASFALVGGYGHYDSRGTYTSGPADGKTYALTASGPGVGLDIQSRLASETTTHFTFGIVSAEPSNRQLDANHMSYWTTAVELRQWKGDWFGGLRWATYLETRDNINRDGIQGSGNSQYRDDEYPKSGTGMGFGITIGRLLPWKGFYAAGMIDAFNVEHDDARGRVVGYRANIGYRWERD